jgi:hypothetical protein
MNTLGIVAPVTVIVIVITPWRIKKATAATGLVSKLRP